MESCALLDAHQFYELYNLRRPVFSKLHCAQEYRFERIDVIHRSDEFGNIVKRKK